VRRPVDKRLEEVDDALLASDHRACGVDRAANRADLGKPLVDLRRRLIHMFAEVVAGHAAKQIGSAAHLVRDPTLTVNAAA
jgi:hypothetical protein